MLLPRFGSKVRGGHHFIEPLFLIQLLIARFGRRILLAVIECAPVYCRHASLNLLQHQNFLTNAF